MSHSDACRKGQFMFNFLHLFFFLMTHLNALSSRLEIHWASSLQLLVAETSETLTQFKLDIDNRKSHLLAEMEPIYWIFPAGEETSSATWVEIFGQSL